MTGPEFKRILAHGTVRELRRAGYVVRRRWSRDATTWTSGPLVGELVVDPHTIAAARQGGSK